MNDTTCQAIQQLIDDARTKGQPITLLAITDGMGVTDWYLDIQAYDQPVCISDETSEELRQSSFSTQVARDEWHLHNTDRKSIQQLVFDRLTDLAGGWDEVSNKDAWGTMCDLFDEFNIN